MLRQSNDAYILDEDQDGATLRYPLHPKQREAFYTDATELLFGGATEGGKSHFVRVALIQWCLAIPGLQCVIIRKQAADVYLNHVEGATGFKVLLGPFIDAKEVKVNQDAVYFSNGSLITLQHCQDERKLTSAQGVEKHVLVFDEATQLPERLIRFIRMWCRMSDGMRRSLPEWARGRFPRIIYTANPIGSSVGYFRRNFVKARPEGAIEEVGAFRRQYIRSLVSDNLSADAKATRGRVQEFGDAAIATALLEANWDAPTGDFFPEWDEDRHVVPDFIPPKHWFRYRTFDWGTAEPFAAYWWAVSDGDSFEADSWVVEDGILVQRKLKHWYPRGALIAYREWYGCDPDPDHPERGVRLRNEDMALGIIERSPASEERKLQTVTDSLPFQDRGGIMIADVFEKCGCPLTLGDTSRESGWSQVRSRLIGQNLDSNSERRDPMIYFQQQCRYARDYLPALPRHPNEAKREDAADHGEATHACDAIRLACTAWSRVTLAPVKEPDTANVSNAMTFDQAVKKIKAHKMRGHAVGY